MTWEEKLIEIDTRIRTTRAEADKKQYICQYCGVEFIPSTSKQKACCRQHGLISAQMVKYGMELPYGDRLKIQIYLDHKDKHDERNRQKSLASYYRRKEARLAQ